MSFSPSSPLRTLDGEPKRIRSPPRRVPNSGITDAHRVFPYGVYDKSCHYAAPREISFFRRRISSRSHAIHFLRRTAYRVRWRHTVGTRGRPCPRVRRLKYSSRTSRRGMRSYRNRVFSSMTSIPFINNWCRNLFRYLVAFVGVFNSAYFHVFRRFVWELHNKNFFRVYLNAFLVKT